MCLLTDQKDIQPGCRTNVVLGLLCAAPTHLGMAATSPRQPLRIQLVALRLQVRSSAPARLSVPLLSQYLCDGQTLKEIYYKSLSAVTKSLEFQQWMRWDERD